MCASMGVWVSGSVLLEAEDAVEERQWRQCSSGTVVEAVEERRQGGEALLYSHYQSNTVQCRQRRQWSTGLLERHQSH